jgi:hypothetical protein
VIAPIQQKRNNISTLGLDDNNDEDDDDNDTNNNDDIFGTPKKHNNKNGKQKHKKRKTTTNHDLVLGAEFENEETADTDNEEGGENNMDNDDGPMVESKKYCLTAARDWTMHAGGGGRWINPVQYTREVELFDVKLVDGDLDKMRGTHGVIPFHKVFNWLLQTFGEDRLYEFVAGRMRNYMIS